MSRASSACLLRQLVVAAGLFACLVARGNGQDPWFYDEAHFPRIRLVFEMEDWHQQLLDNFRGGDDAHVPADLVVDGILIPDVGVRHKGDASYRGKIRENMKITLDAFVDGQNYLGYDIITLDAGRQTSVFNEVVALWVLGDFAPVPRANLAHLIAGTADNPLDLGVFTSTERVDSTFIRGRFGAPGHRYAVNFQVRFPLLYLGDDVADYYGKYDYQGGDYDTRFEDVAAASITLEKTLDHDLKEQLDPHLDIDACMRILIGYRMTAGWDGLEDGNNYYLCENVPDGGRLVPAPWDLDFTFNGIEDPFPTTEDYPLVKIFRPSLLRERGKSYVRHFLERGLAGTRTEERLWTLRDLVIDAILGSRFEEYRDEAAVDAKVQVIVDLIEAVRNRAWNDGRFNRELPTITDLEHEPADPIEGDEIWLRARVDYASTTIQKVLVWSRVQGPFLSTRMHDDGLSHDGAAGDGVFGARLPDVLGGETIDFYLEARPDDRRVAMFGFEPLESEFRPLELHVGVREPGPLLLNELLADNSTGDVDEAGDADDWLEIANTGSLDLDLSGHYLSDDFADPKKWRIPDGTWIPAGGFLRVWADEEPAEGPLHASFKLAKAGEQVLLTASDSMGNQRLDEVVFPAQAQDRSFGRIPDGGGHWFHVWDPTGAAPAAPPGSTNRYDARREGSALGFSLRAGGDVRVGGTLTLDFTGGSPGGRALLFVSSDAAKIDLGDLGFLCVDLTSRVTLDVALDGQGAATLQLPVPPLAAGLRLHAQAFGTGRDLSNAALFTIKP